MTITDKDLVLERPHLGGVPRVYRFPGGYGLSLVNAPMLHTFSFSWEAAVISGVSEHGSFKTITYDTPLTDDTEVFSSDEEANAFIERAREHFAKASA